MRGKEYENFLDLMKKVNLNISLYGMFSSVPKYAKFLKDMLDNKERYKKDSIITLSTNYSCIIKKDIKIPEKLQIL